MSASLVGSEMCIRDRCCPRDEGRGVGHSRILAGLVPRVHIRRISFNPGCLLYTSDAADDM
eukprot:7670297-Alexandrium_andersonii.AAC.1